MLLRLFTTVTSVWRKYYVMMCYYTFLPSSVFSEFTLIAWNQPRWALFTPCKLAQAARSGLLFFFPFPESCLLNLYKHTTNQNSVLKNKYFADKGQYHQSYGFFSSHVWMWELDHKEGWVPKNWCLQIVVLEKTPESPLDCKEIKPVNPKGNESWIFIGTADAEAKAPILWPSDGKNRLIGKDPDAGKDSDAGKDWRQKE